MKARRVSPPRWIGRASIACTLIVLAWVTAGSGCSSQSSSGTGAAGTGAATSTSTSTSSTSTTTTGMGGATNSSTGALTGPTGTGGMGGMGGATGTAGATSAGGAGGAPCTPPTGSADYPAEMEPNNIYSEANPLAVGTKGFSASICPLGDVDLYSFQITAAGSGVTVKTSDGMGGCPLGAHTLVRVEDVLGNVLAMDSGANGCADLSPANSLGLAVVAPGTYYVHVESALLQTIPSYTLDIQIKTPVCGDGIVQVISGEQCDDAANNGMSGDVCSSTCQLTTGLYLNEVEPNDTAATGESLDGYAGAVGEINPGTDVDFYYVDVNVAGSSITATISDGKGGCPNNFDSTLSLYNATKQLLVADSGGGVAPCSKIAPQVYPKAANLPVGRYYLEVARISTTIEPYYVLDVKVTPPSCGDHILPEGTKQCDPPMANPGCSATCQLTAKLAPETEPNNSFAQANPLPVGDVGFVAAINPTGDQDYFSFTVPTSGSMVFISTSDGLGGCPTGFASAITLYSPAHNILQADTHGGVQNCSQISPNLYITAKNLAAGTYYVSVAQAGNNMTQWEYVLNINVYQPGCGDDYLESGEQCDDGAANGTTGDGCSATCQSIAPWEIEPNNGLGTATPAWSGFSTWKGEIKPVGDVDYFEFNLATAGTVTLTTHDVDTPSYCSSDTKLFLYDSGANVVASDDDHGPGPGDPTTGGKCSTLTKALQPGTYFAMVQQALGTKMISSYQLDLVVQ